MTVQDPRMRINMRIPVPGYPRKRMQIFVTFLNDASYYQMVAAFILEYRNKLSNVIHLDNY